MLQLTQLDLFSAAPPFARSLLAFPALEVPEAKSFSTESDQQSYESAPVITEADNEAWLEDLWAAGLNGFADKEEWNDEQLVYSFTIREEDTRDYPGLQAGSRVRLWEDADKQLCFKVFKPFQAPQVTTQ
jgi:hypothetical protein